MILNRVTSAVLFLFNNVNNFFISTAGNLIVKDNHFNASLFSKQSDLFHFILWRAFIE